MGMTKQEARQEAYYEEQDAIIEIARKHCPEHCRECSKLLAEKDDNTFTVDTRYEGDRTVYGSIDIEPLCGITLDECAETVSECPIFIKKVNEMKLPDQCQHCDCIQYVDLDGLSIDLYCEIATCQHNKKFDKYYEEEDAKEKQQKGN